MRSHPKVESVWERARAACVNKRLDFGVDFRVLAFPRRPHPALWVAWRKELNPQVQDDRPAQSRAEREAAVSDGVQPILPTPRRNVDPHHGPDTYTVTIEVFGRRPRGPSCLSSQSLHLDSDHCCIANTENYAACPHQRAPGLERPGPGQAVPSGESRSL